jgi:hypothetical protein
MIGQNTPVTNSPDDGKKMEQQQEGAGERTSAGMT